MWLFFALLTPLLFGSLNIFDKVLRDKHFSTLTLTISGGLASGAALFWLLFVSYDLPLAATVIGFLAGALWFAAGFPYFKALSIEEASRVVPLWQMQSPITLLIATVLLGEKLTPQNYAAFALIAAGSFFLSVKNFEFGKVFKLSHAFWLILVASTGTSIASVLAKYLYSNPANHYWNVQIALLLGNFIGAGMVILIFGRLRQSFFAELKQGSIKRNGLLLLRQAIGLVTFAIFQIAILTGPVSLTIAISGLSSFFVLVAATVLSLWWPGILKEAVSGRILATKAFAIVMIIGGLFLVNLK